MEIDYEAAREAYIALRQAQLAKVQQGMAKASMEHQVIVNLLVEARRSDETIQQDTG